jgi:hypothetical protein
VRLADTGVLPGFDLMPNGRQLIALVPAAAPSDSAAHDMANHAVLMLNFVDELRRRVR